MRYRRPVLRALTLALLLAAACRPPADARATPAPSTTPPANDRSAQDRRQRGLAALDAGRFDLARADFAAILAATPDDLATRALFTAATRALLEARTRAAESFASATPTVLLAPPWQHTVVREIALAGHQPPPQLVPVSATPDPTDEVAWMRRHGLRLPEYEVPNPMRGDPGDLPPALPPSYREHLLVLAIAHPDHTILVYGPSYSGGRFLAVFAADGRRLAFLDFDAYAHAPDHAPTDPPQGILWAEVRDGVLHVAHGSAARTRSTAYLTAIDLPTGALRWRSDPGVAGAADFVLHGEHILAGHGFAGEPARLLVLGRRDGAVVASTPLTRAPDYLFVQGTTLRVRTRDSDLALELR